MRRLPSLLLLLLLGSWAAPRPAHTDDAYVLTLEDVLGPGAFLRTLPDWSWRPGHAQLVRRASSRGGETLLGMDPATGAVETLLDLAALDASVVRVPLPARGIGRSRPPRVLWSPDGGTLCVVSKGDIVHVDLEGPSWRRLTRTASPLSDVQVAPGGRHVAFARDHDLWVVSTSEGVERRLTVDGGDERRNAGLDWVYPEEFGAYSGVAWSRDGSRLAFLQLDQRGVTRQPLLDHRAQVSAVRWMRYPKAGTKNPVARIGVVPVGGGDVVWLDLGSPAPEYAPRLAWMPDGRHVAVVVLDRLQQTLRLLACPADGGPPTVLLEERDPAWVDAPPAPDFLDATRFLWRSHREGCTRWYLASLPADRVGPVAQTPITPRHVNVWQAPTVDLAAGRVAYTGRLLGAASTRPLVASLSTPEAADEPPGTPAPAFDVSATFGPGARHAVLTWSTATMPPRRALVDLADGRTVRDFGSGAGAAFARLALPEAEVGVLEDGPAPVTWRLWRPKRGGVRGRPSPLLVRVYGGPGSRLVSNRWGRTLFLTTYLTQRGYFVLEVDGRGSRGRGPAHERAVYGQLGVHELEDQVRAVRHVTARPDIDAQRVGITGWSYGGTMTCLALTRRSDVFRAGVAIAPVTDWALYDTIYTERFMGTPARNPAGYRESAVVTHAAGLQGHLLLMHGTADDNVHVQNTWALVDALLEAGRTGFETRIYPGRGHGLGDGAHRDVYARTLEFLDAHLR